MIGRLFFGLLCSCVTLLDAQETLKVLLRAPQQLIAAEYFIDRDPGKGLGKSVALPDANEVAIKFSTGELQLRPGGHELYLRFQDQHGHWGHPTRHPFFVMPYGFQTATLLKKGEYFIDEDPGLGKGTSFSLGEGEPVVSEVAVITDTVKPGGHVLYYRIQDTQGNWIAAERHSFFTIPVFEATHLSYRIGDDEMTLDEGVAPFVSHGLDLGHATTLSAPLIPENIERQWYLETQVVLNGGIPWLTARVPLDISAEPVAPPALPPLPGVSPDPDKPAEPVEVEVTLAAPSVVGLGSMLTLGLGEPIDRAVQIEQSGNLEDWFVLAVLEAGETELSISVGVGNRFFRLVPVGSTDAPTDAPTDPLTPPLP